MREIAQKRGLSLMEISKKAESDPSIDEELDKRQKEIGEKEDNFIMDSRLGFYFIQDSYKIFFTVDPEEAAKRIIGEKRKDEAYRDAEQALSVLRKRMQSENKRYKEYYGIDFPRNEDFDLIIDTTHTKPEEIVELVRENIGKK